MSGNKVSGRLLKWFFAIAGVMFVINMFYAVHLLQKPPGSEASNGAKLAEFTLTDQNGKPFSPSQLKGRVWVAGFIYTICPGPCPLVTRNMAVAQQLLSGTGVEFVTITVDPDYDTPVVLKEYAKKFGVDESNWHFLTGPRQQVYKVIQQGFFLVVAPADASMISETGPVVHSTRIAIVDRKGFIREYVDGTQPDSSGKVKTAVAKYLAEK